jgi:hypothetical protein
MRAGIASIHGKVRSHLRRVSERAKVRKRTDATRALEEEASTNGHQLELRAEDANIALGWPGTTTEVVPQTTDPSSIAVTATRQNLDDNRPRLPDNHVVTALDTPGPLANELQPAHNSFHTGRTETLYGASQESPLGSNPPPLPFGNYSMEEIWDWMLFMDSGHIAPTGLADFR